ncbi:acetolactate synthase catalytic subunit [Brevibacterium jeotgali]|uniref:Acetolactate synthase-1/2/3 large subunit n=1 Tax=Brevibacterium jeotgali TaxID=1262550 RepID=A0A2H1L3J2_9MICO|nr:acetolactate synthase catalytic subunit [Brevibacterium jeotgali]TWC01722.1 acetolactate synthase-1/2/3 large subunit [Brevibacterium jeotgali]SMY11467.1 acetolactate synthase-1/2/3 large subunit [Brevibacterium jeotgali]
MNTVADVLAKRLKNRGLRHFFGQSLPSRLVLSLEELGVEQVAYRTENAGGAMADGFARVSGTVPVVTAQNGPAATLLVPPLVEAKLVRSPVLAIVQEVPSRFRGKNAFQEIDHFELFRSSTKAVLRIDEPERAVETLDRAIDLARGGVPGPVVLLTPADILLEDVEPVVDEQPAGLEFPADRTVPASNRLAEAVDALAQAERPLVVAGGGVHRSGATEALREFVQRHRVPVATTNMGKGAVDEADQLSIGVVGNAMAPRSTTHGMDALIAESDVVLVVGARMNENGTDSWKLFPRSATYIQVDIDPEELGRNYPVIRLLGDVDATLRELTAASGSRGTFLSAFDADSAIRRIAEVKASAQETVSGAVDLEQTPIRPERIVKDLAEAVPEDAILVADASYSTIWLSNYFHAAGGRYDFVEPRGMAGLGWGFPMAIGAKVAHPDREVVCLTGDGGFGHVWQEMETLARMGRKVVVVLLDNGILGFQKHAEISKYSGTTTATEFAPVDHAGIAKASGIDAFDVSDPAELGPAISKALDSASSTLIVVKTDPRAYPPITAFGDITAEV